MTSGVAQIGVPNWVFVRTPVSKAEQQPEPPIPSPPRSGYGPRKEHCHERSQGRTTAEPNSLAPCGPPTSCHRGREIIHGTGHCLTDDEIGPSPSVVGGVRTYQSDGVGAHQLQNWPCLWSVRRNCPPFRRRSIDRSIERINLSAASISFAILPLH